MTYMPKFDFSPEDQALLREKLFILLEQKGVRMDYPTVLEILTKRGANVDMATKEVRFPRQLLEDLISKVPKKVLLAAPDLRFDLEIPCNYV